MRSRELVDSITKSCNETRNKKKDNLQYIGVVAPYGYILDKKNKKLIIDKKCAFIVYLIFNLYDKGYGFTTIAEYLNERNIVAPTSYSKCSEYINTSLKDSYKWEKSTIRKIIINKVYNGYYKYSDVKTHEEIINDNLWDRIQNRLNNIKTRTGNDYYDLNGNEFCGKICCSECKQAMTIETSKCKDGITKYLRCSSYDRRGTHKYDCSNKLAIKYNDLRNIVSMFIEKEIFNNKNLSLESIQEEYAEKIKDEDVVFQRKYIKMEKTIISNLLNKYNTSLKELNNSKDNIYLIKESEINLVIKSLNDRLKELEQMQKEVFSFARTFLVSKKDICFDKFIVDSFIDKIYVGVLKNNKRSIEINLK